MNIAIRADASDRIGTGHLMRCLTLADALKKNGHSLLFISRYMPQYLQEKVCQHGHQLTMLPSLLPEQTDELTHSSWLNTSQRSDAFATIGVLASTAAWDWLIVDHYALDERWEQAIRAKVKRIMVIDDIADRRHDCDVLLDQNFFHQAKMRYRDRVPAHTKLLLGPQYSLLRENFLHLREKIKPRSGTVRRLLVFMGGADSANFTAVAIRALASIAITCQVDVVIGSAHPAIEEISISCAKYGFSCYVQTDRMAELMATADLAIGAGGSACWERCCLGLPTLIVSLADNQVGIAKELSSVGACIYIGAQEIANAQSIGIAIMRLLSHETKIAMLSQKSYLLVDGLGVKRVCEVLKAQ